MSCNGQATPKHANFTVKYIGYTHFRSYNNLFGMFHFIDFFLTCSCKYALKRIKKKYRSRALRPLLNQYSRAL